jgi:hypothetical protein
MGAVMNHPPRIVLDTVWKRWLKLKLPKAVAEVTPEMIKAGQLAASAWDDGATPVPQYIEEIYRAMRALEP